MRNYRQYLMVQTFLAFETLGFTITLWLSRKGTRGKSDLGDLVGTGPSGWP